MAKVAAPSVRRLGWGSERWLPLAVGLLWIGLLAVVAGNVVAWGASQLSAGLGLAVVAGALYVVPGLAALRYAWPDEALAWPERIAIAMGIGVALPPLLLELAQLARLPWNGFATLAYVGLAALVLGVPVWRSRGPWRSTAFRPGAHGLLFAGLIAVALLVRLYVVRDLPVGLWGDSYHHTMMAQLLVDNGGLFTSWEPYVPLATFTYHFGFHANVAFFHWLTGVPVTQSLLIVGQILNVAALALAYALTLRLSGSRAAGLWAGVLTGFGSTMPAYYLNWGRYPQLAGQVVLPVLLLAWIALLEAPRRDWRRIGLAGILTACLMLTHYIVTIFAALFVLAYLVVVLLRARGRAEALELTFRALIAAVLALLLALPWLANTLGSYLIRNTAGFVKREVEAERIAAASNLVAITPFFLSWPLLALGLFGLLVALRRRSWRTAIFAVWTLLLIFAVVPHVVGLPGTGVIENFTAYIALYLTVVPLAAYALGALHEAVSAWRPLIARGGLALAVVGLSVWGVRWQQAIVEPDNQLFTNADAVAMEWIREETPPDAVFHVNMFPAYGGTLFAGSDGGWWIPLLSGRVSTLPPITYGSERGAAPDYDQHVNALGYALRDHPLPSDKGIALLRERGVSYVYVGATSGADAAIDPAPLREHPAFDVVYDRDGVVIFALRRAP